MYRELLVNMSRDEHVWRRANTSKGTILRSEPLHAVVTSWRALVLVILKTVVHWLCGQAVVPWLQVSFLPKDPDTPDEVMWEGNLEGVPLMEVGIMWFRMSVSRLLIFATAFTLVAIYATTLAFWPRRTAQPVAFGHLTTLANLVDDWNTTQEKKMWWGDKGQVGNVRHAGTSNRPEAVGEVHSNMLYAGEKS